MAFLFRLATIELFESNYMRVTAALFAGKNVRNF
jgi:hypothetical protein